MVFDYDNTPFLGLSQTILWPLVYVTLSDPQNQGETPEEEAERLDVGVYSKVPTPRRWALPRW